MEDLNKRLEVASKKRDAINADCRRLEGKLEAAENSLAAVQAECRSKGFDPDTIDVVIEKLKARYTENVNQFESEVAAADAALAPFVKEIR